MINKKFIFTCLIMICFHFALGQDETLQDSSGIPSEVTADEEVYSEPIIDSTVNVREIIMSPDSASAWRSRTEFKYIHSLDSLLRKSQEQNPKPVKRTGGGPSFMSRALGGGLFSVVLWSLAILFVFVIIYQLSKSGKIFTGNKKNIQVAESPGEEELILHNNFDELIATARKKQDYRLATRYQFLKVLQQLREKNLIAYEPDKTNSRYLREIPFSLQPAFANLILQYEFAWYGHYDINEAHYTTLEKDFRSFTQKV